MLCSKPFTGGPVPYGCGQCLPCRINRRRQWMWRQFLESLSHEENSFVTLTYNDDHLPDGCNLKPEHPRLWLKRLRKAIQPAKVRFFLVGEYGNEGNRPINPHYHLSIFGMGAYSPVRYSDRVITFEELVSILWEKGFVQVREFNELTAQYVAGYVVKKLHDDQYQNLQGLSPEFARMSNRPGLGSLAMKQIATTISQSPALMLELEKTGDVPQQLQIGRRKIPLGRYLLRKLREEIGFTPEYIEEIKAQRTLVRAVELQELFKATPGALTTTEAYEKSVLQKIRNVESRSRVWKKRGSL